MATIERFEDIEAWKRARQLTRKVYAVSRDGAFSRDFGLKDQMRRASVSSMSNIAEGFERDGTGEFIHFLTIAKGSSGEVRWQLYVALDEGYITQEQFEDLYRDAETVSRMTAGFIGYLQRTQWRGNKFRQSPPPEAELET
ncbi:MAG: four helix bundle protein [Planctomycetaceae bacterium]|nr:four helix bundle protein [Planctomycetaceae bacterium]